MVALTTTVVVMITITRKGMVTTSIGEAIMAVMLAIVGMPEVLCKHHNMPQNNHNHNKNK